jgi:serine/threonine protein kinase
MNVVAAGKRLLLPKRLHRASPSSCCELLSICTFKRFRPAHSVKMAVFGFNRRLRCCARSQIIHRDIKPGNLLLTKDGQLKVADFGVSYMYDGEDDTVQSSAGTAAFLAPEICSGQGASGKMVDLWATGVTLYMMLTGHVPFIAPTLPEIYDKIKNEAIVIPDGVNPAAADLIMRLLHKDPALRLTTKEAKVPQGVLCCVLVVGLGIVKRVRCVVDAAAPSVFESGWRPEHFKVCIPGVRAHCRHRG